MNLDYIKEKKELIPKALLVCSALLVILMLYKVTDFFMLSAKAEDVVQRVIENTQTNNQNTDQYFEASRTMANNLINNNLFAPPAVEQRQWPIREIRGIWDNKVLINNQWYAEGQTVQNAKIVSIEPTMVTIEWDGETRTFNTLDAQIQTQSNERQVAQSSPMDMTSIMQPGAMTLNLPGMELNINSMMDAFNSIRDNPETQMLINEMRSRFTGGGRGGGMGGGMFGGGGRGGRGGGGRGGGRGGRG